MPEDSLPMMLGDDEVEDFSQMVKFATATDVDKPMIARILPITDVAVTASNTQYRLVNRNVDKIDDEAHDVDRYGEKRRPSQAENNSRRLFGVDIQEDLSEEDLRSVSLNSEKDSSARVASQRENMFLNLSSPIKHPVKSQSKLVIDLLSSKAKFQHPEKVKVGGITIKDLLNFSSKTPIVDQLVSDSMSKPEKPAFDLDPSSQNNDTNQNQPPQHNNPQRYNSDSMTSSDDDLMDSHSLSSEAGSLIFPDMPESESLTDAAWFRQQQESSEIGSKLKQPSKQPSAFSGLLSIIQKGGVACGQRPAEKVSMELDTESCNFDSGERERQDGSRGSSRSRVTCLKSRSESGDDGECTILQVNTTESKRLNKLKQRRFDREMKRRFMASGKSFNEYKGKNSLKIASSGRITNTHVAKGIIKGMDLLMIITKEGILLVKMTHNFQDTKGYQNT